mmetsp:Transcript_6934/g.19552  ORF Transcript_6934/g.19552 Transcript_6934/m.19552 type:complete len:201 (+) Transcript_6934:1959-2561(+)
MKTAQPNKAGDDERMDSASQANCQLLRSPSEKCLPSVGAEPPLEGNSSLVVTRTVALPQDRSPVGRSKPAVSPHAMTTLWPAPAVTSDLAPLTMPEVAKRSVTCSEPPALKTTLASKPLSPAKRSAPASPGRKEPKGTEQSPLATCLSVTFSSEKVPLQSCTTKEALPKTCSFFSLIHPDASLPAFSNTCIGHRRGLSRK